MAGWQRLTAMLDSFLQQGLPGCDCIVYHHGKEVFRYFGGVSDMEKGTPVNGKERWMIYSCSKPVTCAAALKLWEQGKFDLDDPLFYYLPEFEHMKVRTESGTEPAKSPITIRQLFTMTAGFSYDLYSPSMLKVREDTNLQAPVRTVMQYLAQEPLEFHPGESFAYSLCHDVLAGLTEVIAGMPFQDYVQQEIFAPLKMEHSTFLLPAEEVAGLPPQYRYDAEKKIHFREPGPNPFDNPYRFGYQYASGGAGCVSTVEDYIEFLEALRRDGQILKRSTVELMSTDQLTPAQKKVYWLSDRYGYGLGVRCPLNHAEKYTDFGWDGAAGSFLAVDLKLDYTVFYAQHVLTPKNAAKRTLLPQIIQKELTTFRLLPGRQNDAGCR